ncbi:MAG: tetratricopeptide repeat protein [Candidatus Sericytochromatia bacterium]
MQRARACRDQGQWQEAAILFQRVLEQEPDQADALYGLSLVYSRTGRLLPALQLLDDLIRLRPGLADAHHQQGIVLHRLGEVDRAVAAYQRALALQPALADAYNHLGNAFQDLALPERALAAYAEALRLDPNHAGAYNNQGNTYRKLGHSQAAREAFEQALRLMPGNPNIHNNLGSLYQQLGQLQAAEAAYRRALALQPGHLEALLNAGNLALDLHPDQAWDYFQRALALWPDTARVQHAAARALMQLQSYAEALGIYQRLTRLYPDDAEAWAQLAWALYKQEHYAEAISAAETALSLRPDRAESWANLAVCCLALLKLPECLAACRQALVLEPDQARARLCRADALLLTGEFQAGFADFGARLRERISLDYARWLPCWQGQDLTDRTLVIVHERGFGDMIQFVRYLGLILERWPESKVTVQFPPALARLIACYPGQGRVRFVPAGEPAAGDYFVSLFALPALFFEWGYPIPAEVPYFNLDSLAPTAGPSLPAAVGFKLGLVWAAARQSATYRQRSLPARAFAPLLELPGMACFSLQVGPDSAELSRPSVQGRLTDLAPLIGDFYDTARLLQELDLLITVDTSVCHLAGALGLAVWTLLPFAPDWRWMLNRSDSYWYPGMRLFRQPQPGDWTSVVQEVMLALQAFRGRTGSV